MTKIRPVSDLRNYGEVLRECNDGEPVYLTKNGRGCYVIMDIAEYEKQQAMLEIMDKLAEAEASVKNGNEWLTYDELVRLLKP